LGKKLLINGGVTENVQNLHLDQLHLEEKAHNALIAANITTIGELDNASSSVIRAIRGCHNEFCVRVAVSKEV
jgi:hypothetical protein